MKTLSALPNTLTLLARAPLKSSNINMHDSGLPWMPDLALEHKACSIDKNKMHFFHSTAQWPEQSEQVHPCFIHTLMFPLQLTLMLDAKFPFRLLGLVHISNYIEQARPIQHHETLDLHCHLGSVQAHPKGWLFTIISAASVKGKVVWQSHSQYLHRAIVQLPAEQTEKKGVNFAMSQGQLLDGESNSQLWLINDNVGRQYAKASGDYNLIHLHPWLAKPFGFNRHIAHGMWSKARCLSSLHSNLSDWFEGALSVNVQFEKAIYLPTKVRFAWALREGTPDRAVGFTIQSDRPYETVAHLQGQLTQLSRHD